MEEKIGIIMHKGNMYNLDKMSIEEIGKLIEDIEKYKSELMQSAEILSKI